MSGVLESGDTSPQVPNPPEEIRLDWKQTGILAVGSDCLKQITIRRDHIENDQPAIRRPLQLGCQLIGRLSDAHGRAAVRHENPKLVSLVALMRHGNSGPIRRPNTQSSRPVRALPPSED